MSSKLSQTPQDPQPRHFLDLDQVPAETLANILADAHALKKDHHAGVRDDKPLAGKTLALIFEKASTRTRVSFEAGMKQLGGNVIVLDASTTQLGRGETVADTARVLSRYVDAIMIRTDAHSKLTELAEHATVPVINGLTDGTHPCQIMADLQTFEERLGSLRGHKIAWIGDGNNVGASWVQAAVQFGFELTMAVPEGLEPDQKFLDWAKAKGGKISISRDPYKAAKNASAVVTDVWVSMGDEAAHRHNLLKPFQVNDAVMAEANDDAIFMHCLPAHREEEVTGSVIDGPKSVVFDEAENRLHAQKAILKWCLRADA